jgi:hypothetical protein
LRDVWDRVNLKFTFKRTLDDTTMNPTVLYFHDPLHAVETKFSSHSRRQQFLSSPFSLSNPKTVNKIVAVTE